MADLTPEELIAIVDQAEAEEALAAVAAAGEPGTLPIRRSVTQSLAAKRRWCKQTTLRNSQCLLRAARFVYISLKFRPIRPKGGRHLLSRLAPLQEQHIPLSATPM